MRGRNRVKKQVQGKKRVSKHGSFSASRQGGECTQVWAAPHRQAGTQEDPRFRRQLLSAPGQPAAPPVRGAGAASGLPGYHVCLLRASKDGVCAPKGVEAAEGGRTAAPGTHGALPAPPQWKA